MKTISTDSVIFKEIRNRIFSAMNRLSDQTTNDKVIDIFENYVNQSKGLIRVRVSSVVLESKRNSRESYTCYITLYFHGSNVIPRADVLTNFFKAGLAEDVFSEFGFQVGDISNYRDASRNLGRGNVEDRSSFSFSLLYERSL